MLRPFSLPAVRFGHTSRAMATKVHKIPTTNDANDFRPPWFYTLTRVLSWTLIPSVALYGIFFYDFGERDHVFRPAREWVEERKAAFLKLSPEEQRIVKAESTSVSKKV